jgi:5-methylcytosine-specific restriction endonuclease McrA
MIGIAYITITIIIVCILISYNHKHRHENNYKHYIIENMPLCPDCGSKIRIFSDRDLVMDHQIVSYYCGAAYLYIPITKELSKTRNCGALFVNHEQQNLQVAKPYNNIAI